MANDVDEFTIKYKVDTGAAAKNLHEFGEHIKKVKKSGDESKDSITEFGEGLLESASNALKAGAIIGTVMAGIAKAITATVSAMKEYNEQLELGKKSGIGYAMQTIISNNMIKANSLLTVADTKQTMKAVTDYVTKAYTNPNAHNRENIVLSRMGVNVFGPDGKPIDTQEAMAKIAEHWKTVSPQQAEAEGREMGINPDAADAMNALGKAITDTTEASLAQVERQQEAAKAAEELHRNLNTFWEDVRTVSRVLTDELMGPMSKLAGKISGTTHVLAGSLEKEGTPEFSAHMGRYLLEKAKHPTAKGVFNYLANAVNPLGLMKMATSNMPSTPEELKLWEETAKKDDEKKTEKKVEKLADEHKEFKDYADPIKIFQRSTNQFAQAVAAMPGSLSEEEAFAAWAGGVANAVIADAKEESARGASSGGSGKGGSGGSGHIHGQADTGQYDDLIKEAAAKYGVSPDLIKKVMSAESKFDPNALSGAGAVGLMQIMPSNFKALGITNANDPRQNIMGGARILSENLKHFGNEPDALRAYNGGWDRSKWGNAETSAYVGRVNSQNVSMGGGSGGKVIGRNIDDNRFDIAARTIANSLNMKSPNLLLRGGVGGKDAAYALNAAESGLGLNIRQLQSKLEGDTNAGRMNDAKDDIMKLKKAHEDLKSVVEFGPEIVARSKDANSDRRTHDMMPVMPLNMTVNVNGVSDPHEVVKIMGEQIQKTIQENAPRITG